MIGRIAVILTVVAGSLFVAPRVSAAEAPCAGKACKCDLVGDWTDLYGVDATFTSDARGTFSVVEFCAAPYKLFVEKVNLKAFDGVGIPKIRSCPDIQARLKFQGGCDMASGKLRIFGIGVYPDVWTKAQSNAKTPVRAHPVSSGIAAGLNQ